jgi:hypothetical protein
VYQTEAAIEFDDSHHEKDTSRRLAVAWSSPT